jgi:glycogen(starch) synthase
MKVLMLGWEYPPHISGGLGTACEGLSAGLARNNIELTFLVPHFFGGETAQHMRLLDAAGAQAGRSPARSRTSSARSSVQVAPQQVPASMSAYWSPEEYQRFVEQLHEGRAQAALAAKAQQSLGALPTPESATAEEAAEEQFEAYGRDIFEEIARFSARTLSLAKKLDFDVIHAHDWMTFPAAVALAEQSKKPLVLHVHSLEFDRSGEHVNQQIYDIERWGMHAARAVVAVSYYTRALIHERYDLPLEKVAVVHNGVYAPEVIQKYRRESNLSARVVLFLGRITFQKGPDYFVEAAAKVIPYVPNVLFVMAGAGDMLQRMVDRVQALGIARYFYFPGFLRGQEVEQMFSLADVYVMPSVSEPFGISALEAISYDTPVIISKQSGVSEVLSHALKVDFWDIDRLADMMINALLHDELRADMVSMAREELRRLHWDAAALKTIELYRSLL